MDTLNELSVPHPVTPYPKLIINAAITGIIPKKTDTPHVPLTINEIINDAIKSARAGASIIHLHARDEDGEPAYNKDLYAQMIKGIRKEIPNLIICVSTSGRIYNTFEKRSDVLNLEGDIKPDMASLTMGSLNFPNQASVNTPEMIEKLASKMKDNGIIPEIEIFDTGMINSTKVLIKKGILVSPFYANIFLGSLYSAPGTLFDLSHMLQSMPLGFTLAAAGIGRFQFKINTASILMGGHVRVGLEDNIFYDNNRKVLATNEMLIQRIVRIAAELGREIASSEEAGKMIGLPENHI